MVALTLPQPTVEAIDAHYEAHQEQRQAQRLTARILGNECERAGWYAFRWANEPKRFAGHYGRANMARQDAMNELAQCLQDVGVKVQRVDPKSYQAIDVTAIDGHYRQKITGIARGVLEAPGTDHLLYLDQQSAAVWRQIVKAGLAVAKPDRVPALQIGMHLLGLSRAFYLVKNKDTDELWAERVHYDAGHAIALLAKGERIRDASAPPDRVSDDPDHRWCRSCPALLQCHADDFALRNCRTCLQSTPIHDGQWHCARHDRVLSTLDQEHGCPHHLYLPGLVPGRADDADETNETVTYHLHTGRVWVDGEGRAA